MDSKTPFWKVFTRERKIKAFEGVERTYESFSVSEKALFLIATILFATGALVIISKISDHFTVGVPARGGTLVEGVVGTPRFINPLLAVSDADRDISALVYSGLLKSEPDGSVVPDLASDYTVSPDGLTYTVNIRPNAKWSDGIEITSDDVAFTVNKAQDTTLKSPRRVAWEGVTVEKTGSHTVVFRLKAPYAPFANNLTMGILPEHIWKNLTSDQFPFSSANTAPVGSGPYIFASISRSSDGIPTELLLKANPRYALGEPYITNIRFKFFANEKSLVSAEKSGSIESASNISPESVSAIGSSARIMTAPLTRVFGVFFNQNENEVLAHKEVRKALSLAVDKDSLIANVLLGYGTPADGPLPPESDHVASLDSASTSTTATASSSLDMAASLLTKAGWKKNASTGFFEFKPKGKGTASSTLSVAISTANIPELVLAAKKIEESWTALGVNVDMRVFEPSDLNQGVIRPRKYDALLFGLVTGKNSDLYPFWHSSQRNDPGLNVALYTNQKADKLLGEMRQATSSDAIRTKYASLMKEIDNDTPAIFLWSPDYIYAVPAKLQGVTLGEITTASDRFANIEKWYIETDHVWSMFTKNNTNDTNN